MADKGFNFKVRMRKNGYTVHFTEVSGGTQLRPNEDYVFTDVYEVETFMKEKTREMFEKMGEPG